MLLNIIICVFILGIFLLLNRLTESRERKRLLKRIDRIQQRKGTTSKNWKDVSLRRKSMELKGLTYWLAKPLPDFKRLGDRLNRAGKHVTPKQYVVRRVLSALIIAFVIGVIFKKNIILALLVGVIIGIWIPLKLLKFSIDKQSKAFLKLFPDAIDLIVRGLRSGLPVSESMILVSSEVPDPVGGIFANIANTMKLGVTLEKSLQETAKKLDMTEFNFFTTSIILQRETGGNLSEILNNLSEVLRNRFIMRMKIKAMSSEARASAMIIGALPFVVLLAVSVLSPDYMTPLWSDYRGNICAGIAAGMMGSGLWIMNRMTKFEI